MGKEVGLRSPLQTLYWTENPVVRRLGASRPCVSWKFSVVELNVMYACWCNFSGQVRERVCICGHDAGECDGFQKWCCSHGLQPRICEHVCMFFFQICVCTVKTFDGCFLFHFSPLFFWGVGDKTTDCFNLYCLTEVMFCIIPFQLSFLGGSQYNCKENSFDESTT